MPSRLLAILLLVLPTALETRAAENSVLEQLAASPNHRAFVGLVHAAGLMALLAETNPITVFAPTDAAFAALAPGTLDRVLRPEAREQLVALVKYHLAAGRILTSDIKRRPTVMMNGKGLWMRVDPDGRVHVSTGSVILPNRIAANGVSHDIDVVLFP